MAIKYWNYASCNIDTRADIGDKCVIHCHVSIYRHVKLGERCRIQCGAYLPDGVELEDDVFIGPRVIFTNDPRPSQHRRDQWNPVKTLVKKGAWIYAGAMIKAGITIGEGAEIGMGAVVLKDVPAREVWVGNPAHKV